MLKRSSNLYDKEDLIPSRTINWKNIGCDSRLTTSKLVDKEMRRSKDDYMKATKKGLEFDTFNLFRVSEGGRGARLEELF